LLTDSGIIDFGQKRAGKNISKHLHGKKIRRNFAPLLGNNPGQMKRTLKDLQ
jgi:hypothetical protein